MTDRKERCETCRWWEAAEHDPPSPEGWCRRNAPQPTIIEQSKDIMHGGSCEVVWPFVRRDDFCGEWAAAGMEKTDDSVNVFELVAAEWAKVQNTNNARESTMYARILHMMNRLDVRSLRELTHAMQTQCPIKNYGKKTHAWFKAWASEHGIELPAVLFS